LPNISKAFHFILIKTSIPAWVEGKYSYFSSTPSDYFGSRYFGSHDNHIIIIPTCSSRQNKLFYFSWLIYYDADPHDRTFKEILAIRELAWIVPAKERAFHSRHKICTARSLRDSLSKFCRSANFKKPEWFSRHSECSMGWTVWGSNPRRKKNFLFSRTSRPVLGPTQPPVQCVWGSFSGVKRPTRKVNHAPPSSVKVKNEWSYTFNPPIAVMTWIKKKLYIFSLIRDIWCSSAIYISHLMTLCIFLTKQKLLLKKFTVRREKARLRSLSPPPPPPHTHTHTHTHTHRKGKLTYSFYTRSQICEKRLLASSCLSVSLSLFAPNNSAHTGRRPWNLIYEDFSKLCWAISSSTEVWK